MKYQCMLPGPDQTTVTKVVNGFIRKDPALQLTYPAELSVEVSSKKACTVEVSVCDSA